MSHPLVNFIKIYYAWIKVQDSRTRAISTTWQTECRALTWLVANNEKTKTKPMPWFSCYKRKYPAFSTSAMGKLCRVKSGLPPPGLGGKASTCNAGDLGSTTGSERSPGGGNSNPHQYSCLENSMDRGAWRGIIHGITKSQTRLRE